MPKGVYKRSEEVRRKQSERQKGKIPKNFNLLQYIHRKGGCEDWLKKQAKIRDDYTCQICGLRDIEIMETDHTKPKGDYPQFAKDLDNLMTLCPNCHRRKTNRENRARNMFGGRQEKI